MLSSVVQPGNLVPTTTTEGVEFDAHGGEISTGEKRITF